MLISLVHDVGCELIRNNATREDRIVLWNRWGFKEARYRVSSGVEMEKEMFGDQERGEEIVDKKGRVFRVIPEEGLVLKVDRMKVGVEEKIVVEAQFAMSFEKRIEIDRSKFAVDPVRAKPKQQKSNAIQQFWKNLW
eukprot:TRINITY_DN22683_c0_g1_i1.p1 TRINITY_DN22683_c0_g1~~TRINITY_DN22683_c0_g1_i1.p1  ORF type:complete len:137 (-),score=46.75 TRINITY_DN22683_c0_g1_i1:71-481(-)